MSSRDVSWGALALAVVALLLFFRITMPNLFWQAFAPAFRVSNAIATETHTFLIHFSDAARLAEQNERLMSENAALANENQMLLKKVENLSALFGAGARKEDSGILAGVVARPPVSPYDTLLLESGKEDGVLLGMEAFGAGGVPVGVVSSVLDDFSRVTLFSASGMTMGGWVGPQNVPLSVSGAGGGTMKASIARSSNIAEGDVVFVPGPGMLPIGSVVRVESDALSSAATLRIQPALNPFSISWVELRMTGVVPSAIATSTSS